MRIAEFTREASLRFFALTDVSGISVTTRRNGNRHAFINSSGLLAERVPIAARQCVRRLKTVATRVVAPLNPRNMWATSVLRYGRLCTSVSTRGSSSRFHALSRREHAQRRASRARVAYFCTRGSRFNPLFRKWRSN